MRRLLFLTIGLLILSNATHARSRSVADSCLHILNSNPKLSSLEKCELLLTSIHNLNYEENFISLTNLLIQEAGKCQSNYHLFYGYYEKGQYHIIHSGKTQEALGLLFKSLEIAKSNQLTLEEGFASYTISRAFYQSNDFQNAELFLERAITCYATIPSDNYIASARLELANIHLEQNNLDSALALYQRTQSYFRENSNFQALAYIQGCIGTIHIKMNQPDSARKSLNIAIEVLEKKQDSQALIPIYIYASENEVMTEDFSMAFLYASKANHIAAKVNNPERKKDAFEQLMKVHEAMGDYQLAYDYQNKYLHLRDSLINIETVTQMANMRADFEIEQKELEVTQMAEAKTMMTRIAILAGISLFMVGILLLIVYRDARRKKTLNKALLEKQSALNESKKALEKASASKDRLFSIISHDLRGPMGTLSGLSQLLTEMLHNNQVAEAGELNDSISDTIRQIEFLLNNLLHWSINQQNIYEPRNETFDLIKLTHSILKMYDQTAKAKQINLALESPFERLKVQSDSNSWGTIIRNLINNALKFTHPNGFVIVKLSLSKNQVVLEVVDSGVGMSPEQIDKLFSFTGDQPGWGTNNEKGQGLGLSLVHDFVTISKGRIAVNSEPGKGSIFRVTIPVQLMEKEVMTKVF
jgi:signal transduction histidine kinase